MSLLEFDNGRNNNREYKVQTIRDNRVYIRKSDHYALSLYYLISWKIYIEEKNTQEPASAIQHLQRLLNSYDNKQPIRSGAILSRIDSAKSMGKTLSNPAGKQNQGRPTKPITYKQSKKNQLRSATLASCFTNCSVFFLAFSKFQRFFNDQFYVRVFFLQTKRVDFCSHYNNQFIFNVLFGARSINKSFLVFFRFFLKRLKVFSPISLQVFPPYQKAERFYHLHQYQLYQLQTCSILYPRIKAIVMI